MEQDRFGILVKQLGDRKYELRQGASLELAQMGSAIVGPLIEELGKTIKKYELLKERYPSTGYIPNDSWSYVHINERIVSVLGEIGDPIAVEPLINIQWWKQSGFFQSNLAMTLGQLGDPKAIDTLLKLLESPDIGASAEAAKALGQFRRDDIPIALSESLFDSDTDTRNNAVFALRQMDKDPEEIKKQIGTQLLRDRNLNRYRRLGIMDAMAPEIFLYRGTRMQDGPMLGRDFFFTASFRSAWDYTRRRSEDGEKLRGRAGVWLYDASLLNSLGIDGHRFQSGPLGTVLVNPQRDYDSDTLPIAFMDYYEIFRRLVDRLAEVTPLRGNVAVLDDSYEIIRATNGLQQIIPTLREFGSERFISTFVRDFEGALPVVARMIEGNLTNEALALLKTSRPKRIQDLQVGFVLARYEDGMEREPDEVIDEILEYYSKYQAGII